MFIFVYQMCCWGVLLICAKFDADLIISEGYQPQAVKQIGSVFWPKLYRATLNQIGIVMCDFRTESIA